MYAQTDGRRTDFDTKLIYPFFLKKKAEIMMTPYDWLVKIYANCYGHMTKMAAMPIYGKNYLNVFFSGTKTPMALGLTV